VVSSDFVTIIYVFVTNYSLYYILVLQYPYAILLLSSARYCYFPGFLVTFLIFYLLTVKHINMELQYPTLQSYRTDSAQHSTHECLYL